MKIISKFILGLFAGGLMISVAYADEVSITMIPIPDMNFEMGKYEVTQGQWQAVMGNNPSYFSDCGENCPVEGVSWNDAQAFIHKLNASTAKEYRLPSEDEWEYACHGGSEDTYCGGNDPNAVGWSDENSGGKTHTVGFKRANGYGLYDMTGNVWEWVQDKYEDEHDWRVLRGGSWDLETQFVRAANRDFGGPASRDSINGFRLARTLP